MRFEVIALEIPVIVPTARMEIAKQKIRAGEYFGQVQRRTLRIGVNPIRFDTLPSDIGSMGVEILPRGGAIFEYKKQDNEVVARVSLPDDTTDVIIQESLGGAHDMSRIHGIIAYFPT